MNYAIENAAYRSTLAQVNQAQVFDIFARDQRTGRWRMFLWLAYFARR